MREKKPVKCITTGEIFASADEASNVYGVDTSNIRKCCNGKLQIAGKDSNGQKLKWTFLNGQNESDRITELETKIAQLEKKNAQLEKKMNISKLIITLWKLQ